MDKKQKKFAAALKELRRRTLEDGSPVSLDKFGKLVGINDRATVARYETGAATPKAATVMKFAALALRSAATQDLVAGLLAPIVEDSGASESSVVMWFLLANEGVNAAPDSKALRRIARRAAELLGEE